MEPETSLCDTLNSTRLEGSISGSALASANISIGGKVNSRSEKSFVAFSDSLHFVLSTPDRVRPRPSPCLTRSFLGPPLPSLSSPSPFATPRKARSGPSLERSAAVNRKLQIFATPLKNRNPRSFSSDRFIPNRTNTDLERARYSILGKSLTSIDKESVSPSELNRQIQLRERLCGKNHDGPLLSFRDKPKSDPGPAVDEWCKFQTESGARKISPVAERILDAPDILNDYYLSPIDWSTVNNCLAVALNTHIYIWNATTGSVSLLTSLRGGDYVGCLKWVGDSGNDILAAGESDGNVALWDVRQGRKIRTMTGHIDRVGSLSWREHVLSSGSRSGKIIHSDVRVADHQVQELDAHTREVCGLSWSPDGRILASGGNDHLLKLWGGEVTRSVPKLVLDDHKAAVKALAWCPWQSHVLASGAGSADQTIKIWNSNNGSLLKSSDAKSQVCALVWSEEYRELVSSHGIPNNQITIWKYPSMEKVTDLNGHTDGVLSLSMSTDRSTVVSAGADETLQLWKCFPEPGKRRRRMNHECNNHVPKSDRSKVISRSGIR